MKNENKMKTIWKYEFEISDNIIIRMPADAEILCVQMQNDIPCIWAKVNPEKSLINRKFKMYGTGHPITEKIGFFEKYIGTIQKFNGKLIFHIFESIQI